MWLMYNWRTALLGLAFLSLAAAPAKSESFQESGRAEVLLLGTAGGPVVRKNRSQPASLLLVNGSTYLVDAGEGVVRQLTAAGIPVEDPRAVFITHHHFDHTAGLGALIAFRWSAAKLSGVVKHLEVYGPPGTRDLCAAALQYFGISEEIFAGQSRSAVTMKGMFNAHDIDGAGAVFEDENIKVTAVENSHFSTMKMPARTYGADKSYSYRFETAGRVIVFTGDTGPSETLTELARGADLLVSEVIDAPATVAGLKTAEGRIPAAALAGAVAHMEQEHLAPEEIGKLAARAGVKAVLLTHFVPGADDDGASSQYSNGVRKYYSGPVIIGEDLSRY